LEPSARSAKSIDAIKKEMRQKYQELHPAIARLGLLYQHYGVLGSNSRCVALIQAFRKVRSKMIVSY
jgi:hypothetical protein